ncbi:Hpt domain-containing protein [Geothrix sp. 21YS21S-4]|uniref:Hpt domain-containing protein n=1 Tax=Geothrix sp. 21YS21S-4 TaxID=3068889 RepID=UPI0027BA36DE|nr:Hpt domain-containing protein [Geothrix sp. 21YS21S-4]
MVPSDLLDPVTLQNLVDLDDGGPGLLSEMLAIFREDTPRRIHDILQAIQQGDFDGLSRAGHALKGGAGALGAKALRGLAADLEHLGRTGSVDGGSDLPLHLEATFQASLAALEAYVAGMETNAG